MYRTAIFIEGDHRSAGPGGALVTVARMRAYSFAERKTNELGDRPRGYAVTGSFLRDQWRTNSMTKRSAVLAAAAAAIFVSGGATESVAAHHEGGEKVKCEGVNSCKGQSECKTDHSSCNGHNECAGKGWVEMSAEECDKAKAAQSEK
jgi:uncharacterized membrane protein